MTDVQHDFDAIEFYIIKSLISSDIYCRTYVSKMTTDLFSPKSQDVILGIKSFFNKYNRSPSPKILEDKILPVIAKKSEKRLGQSLDTLTQAFSIELDVAKNYDWICDETKKFIKTKRIINAVIKVTDLIDEHKHEEIVKTMEDAFQISFDESVGVEYFSALEQRLADSNIREEIIPTGIQSLDNRIGGGYRRKSMFVFAGPSNVGKTLILNDAASTLAFNGYNVLYLSLELSENYIQQRTDAKFANVPMDEVNIDPALALKKAIIRREQLKKDGKSLGRLVYKEYAPNAISSNDIRVLLKNLELQSNFKPDFIIVDYLKLVRPNGKAFSDNTYGKIVTVCEELRALAIEYKACVMSAAQTGRQSYGQTNIGMEDVADSIGIAQTVDVLVTMARNSDLDDDDSMIISIAKSRFSRNGGSFLAKVNYKYMKLIDDQESTATPKITAKKPDTKTEEKQQPKKDTLDIETEMNDEDEKPSDTTVVKTREIKDF